MVSLKHEKGSGLATGLHAGILPSKMSPRVHDLEVRARGLVGAMPQISESSIIWNKPLPLIWMEFVVLI